MMVNGEPGGARAALSV